MHATFNGLLMMLKCFFKINEHNLFMYKCCVLVVMCCYTFITNVWGQEAKKALNTLH